MKPKITDWGLIPYEEAWKRQKDWGLIPYEEAWKRQKECFDAVWAAKQAGKECPGRIVLCEHPHVYTLGRSGKDANMLLGEEQLRRLGATLYHIDRGGTAAGTSPTTGRGSWCATPS